MRRDADSSQGSSSNGETSDGAWQHWRLSWIADNQSDKHKIERDDSFDHQRHSIRYSRTRNNRRYLHVRRC